MGSFRCFRGHSRALRGDRARAPEAVTELLPESEFKAMNKLPTKIRVPDLALMKERGERIVMLTAYDATMARIFDRAGVDLLLVGDSLGNVILGLDTTIP